MSRRSDFPRAPRYQLQGVTAVYDDGRSFEAGAVVEASVTGLFIESETVPPVGSVLSVLPAHSDDRLPLAFTATVVRTCAFSTGDDESRLGLALALEGLSSKETERLHSFLVAHGTRLQA